MSKIPVSLALLVVLSGCQSAIASDPAPCVPVQEWSGVPTTIRVSLENVVGTIASKSDDFNASDVTRSGLASNRFLAACRRNGLLAVALERGGRGYHIEVFHYAGGKLVRRWSQLLGLDGTASVNLLEPPHER